MRELFERVQLGEELCDSSEGVQSNTTGGTFHYSKAFSTEETEEISVYDSRGEIGCQQRQEKSQISEGSFLLREMSSNIPEVSGFRQSRCCPRVVSKEQSKTRARSC